MLELLVKTLAHPPQRLNPLNKLVSAYPVMPKLVADCV
jgi:hypothetical protein